MLSIFLVGLLLTACNSDTVYPVLQADLFGNQNTAEPTPIHGTSKAPQVTLTYNEQSTGLMVEARNFPATTQLEIKLWVGIRPVTTTFQCQTSESGYCVRPMGFIGKVPHAINNAIGLFASAQSLVDTDVKAFSPPIKFRASSQGIKSYVATPTPSPTPTLMPPTSTCTCTPTNTAASTILPAPSISPTPSPTEAQPAGPVECVICTLTPTPRPTHTPRPTRTPEASITLAPTLIPQTPTHTATPTPIPIDSRFLYWRGEYYNNPQFLGDPVLIRDDAALAFNWERHSPVPGAVPRNRFSVRWSQRFVITNGGRYTFYLDADDEAVVRINGEKLMEYRYNNREEQIQIATRHLDPGMTLNVEVSYVDHWGDASIKFWWELATEPPCWHGHYFDNADLGGEVVAQETLCGDSIRKHWGVADTWPATLGPDTHFSTCWTRIIETPLPISNYRLCLYVKDSARLWHNRTLLINKRSIDVEPQFICKDVTFNPDIGTHVLRLDLYRKSQGDAILGFYLVERRPNCAWTGGYFINTNLSGPPTFVQMADELNIPSPKQDLDARLSNRAFSSLWQRRVSLNKGIYYFFAEHDDGVQLAANRSEIMNDWADGEIRTQMRTYLATGNEALDLKVKHYHDNQGASPKLHLWWEKATPTPTITPTPSVTPTPSPTFLPTQTPLPTPQPTVTCITPTPEG